MAIQDTHSDIDTLILAHPTGSNVDSEGGSGDHKSSDIQDSFLRPARMVGFYLAGVRGASLLQVIRVFLVLSIHVVVSKQEIINVQQVRASYDYIVVGGGTAGLVVASELSDDPSKTVLVVEYGSIATDPAQNDPSSALTYKPEFLYNVTSVPLPGLNGLQNATVFAAAVVGGASQINGMMLLRASPQNYDDWESLSNPGWSWTSVLPYFKRNTQLTPPRADLVKEFNITWDLSAYGTRKSPIHGSYPSFLYPNLNDQVQGLIEAGVHKQREGALHAIGVFWLPSMMDAATVKRSNSFNSFFLPRSSRRNLHLLTNHRVNEVLFDRSKRASGITFQERGGHVVRTVKAKREIVLSAGFLHTPQILQRSGIGPADLLRKSGIPVIVDLPGVGANFQDHSPLTWNYTFATDLFPNPNALVANATFIDEANKQWAANRTGPLSYGRANIAGWIPLPVLAPDWKTIVRRIDAQDPAAYLPKGYDSTLIRGYKVQLSVLKNSFSANETAVIEIGLNGTPHDVAVLVHPLSRGTIRIDPKSKYDEPIVDFNTFSNPVDPLISARSVQFVRKWMSTPSMQALSPIELGPGPTVSEDEDLISYARANAQPGFAHGCCTAAMSPRSHGGVVSPDLRVYGVSGLSVADLSIPPIHVGAHPCETVYMIGAKAADFIKARHAD